MAKENVQKNRFKVAREMLEASDQELRARNADGESDDNKLLSNGVPVQEVPQGKNAAERYAILMMKDVHEQREKQGKCRINLFVPSEVKEEMDRMVDNKEIKNISHFINYLIADYMRCRDLELDDDN